jgi:DNA-directed RNA polymerase subunit H (RpoH/RPB5)
VILFLRLLYRLFCEFRKLLENNESRKVFKLIFCALEYLKECSKKKMHALQPQHVKLTDVEVGEILEKFNISVTQLSKISKKDPALADKCSAGDVVKIVRKDEEYFRVVV